MSSKVMCSSGEWRQATFLHSRAGPLELHEDPHFLIVWRNAEVRGFPLIIKTRSVVKSTGAQSRNLEIRFAMPQDGEIDPVVCI